MSSLSHTEDVFVFGCHEGVVTDHDDVWFESGMLWRSLHASKEVGRGGDQKQCFIKCEETVLQ